MKILRIASVMAAAASFLLPVNSHASCTSAQAHPPGEPTGFDINGTLDQLKKIGDNADAIAALAPDMALIAESMRLQQTYTFFRSRGDGDFKNNSSNPSSEAFGNWFYGAALHEIGFSLDSTLRAAALYQQWQNYAQNTQHPNYGDLSAAVSGTLGVITGPPGTGDGPNDVPFIVGGYDYAENVRANDPPNSTLTDSCDPNSSSTDSSATTTNSTNQSAGSATYTGAGTFLECSAGAMGHVRFRS